MPVGPANDADVQCRFGIVGEGAHPVVIHRAGQRTLIVRTSADIDARLDERVVHGNRLVTVTSGVRRSELGNRSAHRDRHVFGDVVLQIARRLELHIQRRVPGQNHHHVIEKGDASGDFRRSASALELQPDSGLSRLPLHNRHSVNSSATARGSTAPVYSAMPMIAAETPRSASARRSQTPVIPPAA